MVSMTTLHSNSTMDTQCIQAYVASQSAQWMRTKLWHKHLFITLVGILAHTGLHGDIMIIHLVLTQVHTGSRKIYDVHNMVLTQLYTGYNTYYTKTSLKRSRFGYLTVKMILLSTVLHGYLDIRYYTHKEPVHRGLDSSFISWFLFIFYTPHKKLRTTNSFIFL